MFEKFLNLSRVHKRLVSVLADVAVLFLLCGRHFHCAWSNSSGCLIRGS